MLIGYKWVIIVCLLKMCPNTSSKQTVKSTRTNSLISSSTLLTELFSVSKLCGNSEDSSHENTVLYYLREKFDLESVERVGNTLLQKSVLDVLPEQVEVSDDLPCGPTTVTKTIQTASTTPRRSVELLRSTATRHSVCV